MTVTDFRIPAPRQATHDEPTVTPESERLADLRRRLAEYADDPAVGGWADDIRTEIAQLQAVVLEA
jgi:hypothetical protein